MQSYAEINLAWQSVSLHWMLTPLQQPERAYPSLPQPPAVQQVLWVHHLQCGDPGGRKQALTVQWAQDVSSGDFPEAGNCLQSPTLLDT